MERIRLSQKKSCFASFISALLISRASDGSLTGLMIGDDKLRTLPRSPIRSVAELDVINLILHFLHLVRTPPNTKTPCHIHVVCANAHMQIHTHRSWKTKVGVSKLWLVGPLVSKIWPRGRSRGQWMECFGDSLNRGKIYHGKTWKMCFSVYWSSTRVNLQQNQCLLKPHSGLLFIETILITQQHEWNTAILWLAYD